MQKEKIKTIVVTGGNGFIGGHLIRRLLSEGYRVINYIRENSPKQNIPQGKLLINLDYINLEKYIDINKCYAFIHLATNYGRENCYKKIYESNIELPSKLLELLTKADCKIFINTDTFYGKSKNNYAHMTPYINSKKCFVELSKIFCALNAEVRVLNFRLEHVYGPMDGSEKFIPKLIEELKKNKSIELTMGNQERDFIYIEDVTNAYCIALKNIEKIQCGYTEYEIGTGVSMPVKEIVKLMKRLIKSSSDLKFGALPYRDGEIMKSKANIRAISDLGWCVNIETLVGLKSTLITDDKVSSIIK